MARQRGGESPVVLGVDVGTTSTKVLAVDRAGQEVGVASHGYPLDEPSPGREEQDPESIVAAVLAGLREVGAAIQRPVAGLCLSTAMHGLMALDARERPAWAALQRLAGGREHA